MKLGPTKVYLNDNDQATIICTSCGRQKVADASKFKNFNAAIKVKCSCGHNFAITFEKRKHYRKSVKLFGKYLRTEPSPESGEIIIQDISRTGVRFKTQLKHNLKAGEIIKVQFVLDDAHNSPISQNVVVRRAHDSFVGAEFCDGNIPKALLFYLMP